MLGRLQERAKELNCFYQLEALLSQSDLDMDAVLEGIIVIIPPAFQYSEFCRARIDIGQKRYQAPGYRNATQLLSEEIKLQGEVLGRIHVIYTDEVAAEQGDAFLPEERKLIKTIADRIAHTIFYRQLRQTAEHWDQVKSEPHLQPGAEWITLVDMLLKSDKKLFLYLSQKMLHYLRLHGVNEANDLLRRFETKDPSEPLGECNIPSRKKTVNAMLDMGREIFDVASRHFEHRRILTNIQRWMQEEKSRFLVRAIDDPNASLTELIDAITRYHHLVADGAELSHSIRKGLRVSLVRRFFSDQLDFVNIAKNYVDVEDYYDIAQNIIFPANSRGSLGGKSAGLFLAEKIVKKCQPDDESRIHFKVPRTWYITSDGLMNFVYYNNLEEVIEQKYKDMDEVFLEYPNLIYLFKNAPFPPEIIQKLSNIMDDIGEVPIIVRSSSLLEDRLGAAFSGKYKSLFLANQGGKAERLEALTDAIAEIYASTFGPDPIEYRREKGLLDFFEEMGIMIQEVVGKKVGPYFFPAFAGVAFSRNEFRWSPRIKREDGLLRLVPGLGTRAVDRVADDYPVLIAPGNPGLRVNVTPDEIVRYSPRYIDVIHLEENQFVTLKLDDVLKQYGAAFPMVEELFSLVKENDIRDSISLFNLDFEKDQLVPTFAGVMKRSNLAGQMKALLALLEETIQTPVDLEFAHDGEDLYLLQCRPQSYAQETAPAPIPPDIAKNKLLFSTDRFVSNGMVGQISHIVYVRPEAYNAATDLETLKSVGRAVSHLNKVLPKRQFILMGPGRWGSRGDIKLGVNVTYADINNTAVLIEIAKKTGRFTPDLSFGTHFFQDLVEAGIRYLPLYPDEPKAVFNEIFFRKAPNILEELAPKFADLSDIVQVIDVQRHTGGQVLQLLMNGDLGQAVAVLSKEAHQDEPASTPEDRPQNNSSDEFWRWRAHMAEKIASKMDGERFGVKRIFVFGSTKNATAGPGSDIDLLIHFVGTESQRSDLQLWLDGWSLTLAEMNFLKTGYASNGLLDVHYVTDEDIEKRSSFAVKIGAVTDAARPLRMKRRGST